MCHAAVIHLPGNFRDVQLAVNDQLCLGAARQRTRAQFRADAGRFARYQRQPRASHLSRRLGAEPEFTGSEASSALLVDCSEADRLFGAPEIGLETMLDWTADWIRRGGASLDKPTHYEARDGKY